MTELEHLRSFAAAARRGGFGVPFFKLDGNNGQYRRTGKTDTMNGQKLACDPVDAMSGWQNSKTKFRSIRSAALPTAINRYRAKNSAI